MARKLLIFALEYYGYHSVRGTALAKRARHLAESFSNNGWEVTVIHKDQINESKNQSFKITEEQKNIRRISVHTEENLETYEANVIVRKTNTLTYITFYGDRSYKWAKDVIKHFPNFNINEKPDCIISIFTPRAPLYLGSYFSKKLGVPWLADLQDPVYRGISKRTVFFSKLWVRRILKTAKAIVHVSPEWAAIDAKELGLKINTIRHGIPEKIAKPESNEIQDVMKSYKDSFNVFYGGSLSPNIQSLSVLKKIIAFGATVNITVKVFLAANETVHKMFSSELGEESLVYLGWLPNDVMNQYIYNCQSSLVVPWSKEKIGIPSKFYEFCSYPKPIWIIGNDLGAFNSVLSEWKHPEILFGDIEFQKKALLAAAKQDFQYFFNLSNCKAQPLYAKDLYKEYVKLVDS